MIYGTPDQGSGSATVVQRVLAAELGIARDRIGVRRHNTSDALVDPGAGASRVTHIVGNATISAARRLKARLEARSGMQLVDGDFVDAAGKRESFADVAGRVCAQGPLRISGDYNSEHEADHKSGDFSFSAFAIEVAVDRETGAIKVVDAVLVIDVATILNPIGHQGQIEGGFVYGIGGTAGRAPVRRREAYCAQSRRVQAADDHGPSPASHRSRAGGAGEWAIWSQDGGGAEQ